MRAAPKPSQGLDGSKAPFRLGLKISPLHWSAVAPSLGADFFYPALRRGLEGCSPLMPVVTGCRTSNGQSHLLLPAQHRDLGFPSLGAQTPRLFL